MGKKVNLKSSNPFISVVMATYNGNKYIEEQIDSILNQTVLPDELLIIDDHSSDDTLVKINDMKSLKDTDIRLVIIEREKNMGYIDNFMDGISRVRGEIVLLCDQDDLWEPNKVEELLTIFKKNNRVVAIHSDTNIIDEAGNILSTGVQNYKKTLEEVQLSRFIKKVNYPGMALAFRKDRILDQINDFKSYGITIPTHDWLICYFAVLQHGFYTTNKILTFRRYTGLNVALDINSRRLTDIQRRISGIELYDAYFKLIEQYQNISGKDLINIREYRKVARFRMEYLKKHSLFCYFKNVRYLKYYPSFKSYLADGLLVVKKK